MKKGMIVLILVLMVVMLNFVQINLTGKVVEGGAQTHGIPIEEQECMQTCVSQGCKSGDTICMTANSEKCLAECAIAPHTPVSDEEACMEECISQGCTLGLGYADCTNNNLKKCEDECGMKGDEPDESEMSNEQLCITHCVAKVDPELQCGNSQEGETGNEVCQRCASECVHLYEGPCLNDEQLREKEKACQTCEHCYGKHVMGDSGEGWECIIDVECADASGEFGNNPGSGPGVGEEGFINQEEKNIVEKVTEGIVDFFKGIFGGDESS